MMKLIANEATASHVKNRHNQPLPVGSIIVKEKWYDAPKKSADESPKPETKSTAQMSDVYAAMIKREAGYDTKHGDWEYLYVTRGADSTIERGQLHNCRECQSKARNTDFLFLPDPTSDLYLDD